MEWDLEGARILCTVFAVAYCAQNFHAKQCCVDPECLVCLFFGKTLNLIEYSQNKFYQYHLER